MASTMASTLALSRPSEKLGTHSTNVFGTKERINQQTILTICVYEPPHTPGSILKVAIS